MPSTSTYRSSTRESIRHLSRCRLFSHMGTDRLEGLMRRFACRRSHHGRGNYVYLRGDEYSELAILLSGTLKAEMVDTSGHTLTVETLKAAQPIASSVLFADENYMPVDILAETDVEFIRFDKMQIHAIAQDDPVFFQRLLEDMGNRVVFLSRKLWTTHFNSLKKNLAGYLLRQAEGSGSAEFTIARTKKQLADLFGVARQSVNRACTRFAEEGIIEFEGRHFKLLRKAKLVQIVEDDE